MGLAAGNLDRRIEILRAGAAADDGYTTKPGAFEVLATVAAEVKPAPGNERFASGENAATAPTMFRIRWSSDLADLDAKDRVRYPVETGREFDIKSVVEIGRREGIEILGVGRRD